MKNPAAAGFFFASKNGLPGRAACPGRSLLKWLERASRLETGHKNYVHLRSK